MITSTGSRQMKHISHLMKKARVRREEELFVVEGKKMCREAPAERLVQLYVSESFRSDPEAKELLRDRRYEMVSDPVFKSVSDTLTPQGILGVVKMPRYDLADLLCGSRTHLLALEGIQDPGNLGTMLRTGECAGITGILMDQTTVDLFHPKTVRSTMGSIYRVPYYVAEDFAAAVREVKKHGITVYAAHLKGTLSYDEPSYREGTAFLIGNEGNGLTAETAGLADERIKIPMEGCAESLNAAVSAALLMYEAARQRRHCGGRQGERHADLV